MIRKATIDDKEWLKSCYKKFHREISHNLIDMPSDEIQDDIAIDIIESFICVIAENDSGERVGFAAAALCDKIFDPASLALSEFSLWVDPSSRADGHGLDLVGALVEIAKKTNLVNEVTVKIDPRSEFFYNSLIDMGFSPTGMEFSRRI